MPEQFEKLPDDKRGALEELLRWLIREKRLLSPTRIQEEMQARMHFLCVPSHDTITRFIEADKSKVGHTADHFVVSLAYYIGMKYKTGALPAAADVHADIIRYCILCYDTWSLDKIFTDNFLPRHKKSRDSLPAIPEFRTLMAATDELRMPAESLPRALDAVFSPEERAIALETRKPVVHCFSMYRYSVVAGFIDKSLTKVSFDPMKGYFAAFENIFFDRNRNKRVTTGFVTNTGGKVYMVGGVDNFRGMKFIGFSGFSSTKKVIPGMLMSLSSAGTIICARTVFIRSDGDVAEDKLGYRSVAEYRAELGDSMKLLANSVEFTLDRGLLYKNKPCTQRQMVLAVAELLKDKKGAKFIYDDDRTPFNPADSSDYTFNSALEEAG